MKFIELANSRMTSLGIVSNIVDGELILSDGSNSKKIKFEPLWESAYQEYQTLRTKNYDISNRVLQINNRIEIMLTTLSQPFGMYVEAYDFIDTNKNTVHISNCSAIYKIALFESSIYDGIFESRYRARIFNSKMEYRNFNLLIPNYYTAVYTHKGRKIPANLCSNAIIEIEKCLFKLAVEFDESLIIYKQKEKQVINGHRKKMDYSIMDIPKVIYESNVVKYYKVAKASTFASQCFLSYYHVLEYYFLQVAELKLHDRLAGVINSPSFKANNEKLDKVISIVRGQDSRNDETEMLRNVLDRYINEDELLLYISELEKDVGEKVYTKKRKLFGENIQINPLKDHALANTAQVLKHIRNAIVHSSDRYNHEECHIPLTDSEDIINEYIPLIKYLAEKIIYGNAK